MATMQDVRLNWLTTTYRLGAIFWLLAGNLALAQLPDPHASETGSVARQADSADIESAILEKGTQVLISIEEPLNSKTSHPQDIFRFKTAQDVFVGDRLVIAEGTPGFGEVIHSDRARMSGSRGELILAARYIEQGDHRITLSRFRFGIPEELAGTDLVDTATALSIAGFAVPGLGIGALFLKGGEFEVPVGTLGHARVKESISLPVLSIEEPAVSLQGDASSDLSNKALKGEGGNDAE